jgi:hypothetical protein
MAHERDIYMKGLNIWEEKVLRKIYGPVVEQGVWRIRKNQGLRNLFRYLGKVADIKKKILDWIWCLVSVYHAVVI